MSIGAGLGIADYPFSDARGFWQWVELCEEGGVDSIWQTDRLVSSKPILECMSVMAALAGATKKLKFGMNVASVAMRDPLLLAKQCATIDVLSDGRLLPAFGIGSTAAPEWEATALPRKGRGTRTNEGLEIIARLWREESVTFEGTYYQYTNARISPRPIQQPLPLWLGGASEAAIRRTARYGTGWLAGAETPEKVGPVVAAIKQAVKAAGRQIDADHYGAGFPFRFGGVGDEVLDRMAEAYRARTGRDLRRVLVDGDADDILERLKEYVAAGISKFVLRPVGEGDADVMEQTRLFVREVLPEVPGLEPA
jgi:probable F420-dependent oxidoreductase